MRVPARIPVLMAACAGLALPGCEVPEQPSQPPQAVFSVQPAANELGLVLVTRYTFTAIPADPQQDRPLTFRWDFGDQNLALGETVTHVYATVGTFTVTLSVSDGELETRRSSTLTVGNLIGNWDLVPQGPRGELAYEITESTRILPGNVYFQRDHREGFDLPRSQAREGRQVTIGYRDFRASPVCEMTFNGQVDAALQTMTGAVLCEGCPACAGQTRGVTLFRRP